MPQIHILAVGRIREGHWLAATEKYAKNLKRGYTFVETIVKDGAPSLSPEERKGFEGEKIIQALKPGHSLICLDEHGKQMSSPDLARFLQKHFDSARTPCFIIGGAYGLSHSVLQRADHILSLSEMTFPHELARVLLFEQLYRADAILRNSPYHHE